MVRKMVEIFFMILNMKYIILVVINIFLLVIYEEDEKVNYENRIILERRWKSNYVKIR